MQVTIVGGGNIGTQFAVHWAEKGHEVTVYTSTPYLFDEKLKIVDDNGIITHEGKIRQATYDPEIAFKYAELIIVTLPPNMMQEIAEVIYLHSSENCIIGIVPGNGGGECAFKRCIERGNVFWGLERVPAIARLIQKGKVVKSIGYREELHLAALPKENAADCCELISSIFNVPCKALPDFLNLTLTPSNPILHTVRLKTVFKDWEKGVFYKRVPLFYEEWNDEASKLLFLCDDEVQNICRSLIEFELKYVKSLKEHYESYTVKAMTQKISSIKAFQGILTPMVKMEKGYLPDFNSRYFIADFPYGLTIIKQVAEFAGVNTPNIDSILDWYKSISISDNHFNYKDYDIIDKNTFLSFYSK